MSGIPVDPIHIWVNPPDTVMPVTRDPFRVAVGTPDGPSSNQWRVWTRKGDVYVACGDNFKEFKVSLHEAGIWRVAFTAEALEARPDLATDTGDRVLNRRVQGPDDLKMPTIAFQIVVLGAGLYLPKGQREKWRESVVFVEPPSLPSKMTVLSVCVAPNDRPMVGEAGSRGAVLAILPFSEGRTVQVVATQQTDAAIKPLIDAASGRAELRQGIQLPDDSVFVTWGTRPDHIPWFSAIKYSGV